jgi:hypothetical protein
MAGRRWQKTQWHLESVFPGRTVDPAGLPKSPTTCPSLFNSLVLGADGSNMVCCHSNRKAWEHASLLDRSLEEVWNSEPYVKTREYALGRTADRAEVFPQCEHCCWL